MSATSTLPSDRPRPVAAASWLLYLLAALPTLSALLQLVFRADPKATGGDAFILVPGAVVIGVLVAALGRLCAMGRNVARVVVWLMTAGAVLNIVAVTVTVLQPGSFASRPDWYPPFLVTVAAVQLIVLVAASILLALPTARPFFRRRMPQPPSVAAAGG
ncbi:hypothetical protein [Micromonospora sp. CB01531]|uniref:hypothetical protein n=1 Tax=Micromonospora sp. CB01531 TaxID=1718947 RepID=UPI000939E435|nr:hypothetical protein [Micromonospora sp. CB01531]OKI58015.1 hypothetical protein A6A27_07205 [Micromonospora sp. CB01531]